jgi:hypothetical protein
LRQDPGVKPFPLSVALGKPPAWSAKEIRQFEAHVADAKALLTEVGTERGIEPDRLWIVVALMEALADVRWELDQVDRRGKLRLAYEAFRCELERAGLPVRWATRRDRAKGHRRLGELAETRGDVVAAVWHFDQAVRAWRDVGCRRRPAELLG